MWFERLMGFREQTPEQVRANIACEDEHLTSRVNGAKVRCGRLSIPSLAELRNAGTRVGQGRAKVSELVGDVALLHKDPANAGALFQAASQFNLLEMTGPDITPERGVGIYEHDRTQGPACAIACGGGTIYRNYFVEVGGQLGQTADRQVDCLAELGAALGPGLWEMRNGYALVSDNGLRQITARLEAASDDERDELRGLLRVGVQNDVAVLGTHHIVTQVYGAALPVAYGEPPTRLWAPFARLVLEASYEATVRVAQSQGIDTVFLTLLGGGVFGNDPDWIVDSVVRALAMAAGLDVRIVSHGKPSDVVARIVREHEVPA